MKKVVAAVIGMVAVLAFVSCDLLNPAKPRIMVLTAMEDNENQFFDFGHEQLIDFGKTQANVAIDKTFKVRNVGDAQLTIESVTPGTSQTVFSVVGDPIENRVLLPDQEISFVVQFLSDHVDDHDTVLIIPNDDPDASDFFLRLSATVEHTE